MKSWADILFDAGWLPNELQGLTEEEMEALYYQEFKEAA